MIGTGKYDFPGIRKAGAVALKAIISSTGWGVAVFSSPFKPVAEFVIEWIAEYLTNKGLLMVNVATILVDGEIDQHRFDACLDAAIEKLKIPGLTVDEKRAIDDKVKNAFREFARVGNKH